MKNLTIGVLFGTLLHENMGCNALNYSFLQCCDMIAKRNNAHFRYIFFWDISNHYTRDDLPVELLRYDIEFIKVPESYLRLFLKGVIKDKMQSFLYFFQTVKRCDLFFDSCGGDSFSDIYGPYTLKYIGRNHSLLTLLNKSIVFLPQTIGPFATKEGERKAKKMIRNAQYIFVRDKISLSVVNKLVERDNTSQTLDMAFFLNYQPQKGNDSIERKRIGVSPSALLWHGGYTRNNQFNLKTDYQCVIKRTIEFLVDAGFQVVLLAHVLYGTASKPREDDYWLCKRLKQMYPSCEIAPYFYTPMEAKSYISSLDGLLSSRMHCCIAAYSSCVPVFPLGYSRKFSGLFTDTLGYAYGADLRADEWGVIHSNLKNYVNNLARIKKELEIQQEHIQEEKNYFVNMLEQSIIKCIGG